MPLSVFGVEISLTDLLLGLILIFVAIGLARLESRANLILYALSDIRQDIEPLVEEARERGEGYSSYPPSAVS